MVRRLLGSDLEINPKRLVKVYFSRLIPLRPFVAINLMGWIVVRSDHRGKVDETLIRHEKIHTAQMRELLYVGFYLIYAVEWVVRRVAGGAGAYWRTSFEREAYAYQIQPSYLQERKHFAWLRYWRER